MSSLHYTTNMSGGTILGVVLQDENNVQVSLGGVINSVHTFYEAKEYLSAIEAVDSVVLIYENIEYTPSIEENKQLARLYHYKGISLVKTSDQDGFERNIDKSLELFPDYAEANFSKGQILSAREQYKEAIEYFNKAITLGSTNYTFSEIVTNGKLLSILKSNIDDTDKQQQSVECIDAFFENFPDQAGAINYNSFGVELMNGKMYSTAIAYIDKALLSTPLENKHKVLANKFSCLLCLDKLVDYKLDDESGIHREPMSWLNYKKGCALLELKEYKKSIEYFDTAIAVSTNYEFSKNITIYKLASLSHLDNVEDTKKILLLTECAQSLSRIFPNDTSEDVNFNLRVGIRFLKNKMYDDSIEYFDKALPNSSSKEKEIILSNKIVALLKLNKFEEANVLCDDILTNIDNLTKEAAGNAYFNKGVSLLNLKGKVCAEQEFDKATKICPSLKENRDVVMAAVGQDGEVLEEVTLMHEQGAQGSGEGGLHDTLTGTVNEYGHADAG